MDKRLLGVAAGLYGVDPEGLSALHGGHAAGVFGFERDGHGYVMRVLPPDVQ